MGHASSQTNLYMDVPQRIQPALSILEEACRYAEQTNSCRWEFAVEMEQLEAVGLNNNDFRWMVRKGLVEHQKEVTLEGDDGRAFRRTGDLIFPARTCFVLAEDAALATQNIDGADQLQPVASPPLPESFDVESMPQWDMETRELTLGTVTVKRFKWRAVNQETVLAAFQEEGWPHRIDDPLPPHKDQDSKRRLSDTIKCLNRKQVNALIHFIGDGTGQGVIWERPGRLNF